MGEAAEVALVSRQRVRQWCRAAGIKPGLARRQWLAGQILLAEQEEERMATRNWNRAKQRKPTEDGRSSSREVKALLRAAAPPARPRVAKADMRQQAEALCEGMPVRRIPPAPRS